MTSLFLGIDETGWLVISVALNFILLVFLYALWAASAPPTTVDPGKVDKARKR